MEHLKSKTPLKRIAGILCACAIFASCSAPKMKVDLVLINGEFCTFDLQIPDAQAVAVNDGRIVAVGTSGEVASRFEGKATVDLNGAFVMPGLTDGHGHISDLGFSLTTLDLRGAKSPGEVGKILNAIVSTAAAEGGTWIRGRGWNQDKWPKKAFPTHDIIDKVPANVYVLFVRADGHAIWVNENVMDLAGITRATKDPEGGRIVRDKKGEPTGVFLDAAIDLIASKIPPPTDPEIEHAVLLAADTCARYGLTEVQDAGVDAQTLRVYQKLADEGKLRIRIYAEYLGTDSTLPAVLKKGPMIYDEGLLTMRSIIVYMDGALGAGSAALVQPYTDDPGNYGLTEMSEKDLENLTIASISNGFQVCTHAMGDRANDIVLNAYDSAMKIADVKDPRLRIEHAQVLLKDDLRRFKKLEVIPSMQPEHCTSDMYWAEARLGPKRIKGYCAWQSLLSDGNIIAGGSDFPFESPDPRLGIYAAITRQDLSGMPRNFEDAEKYFDLTPDAIMDSLDFDGGFFPVQKMSLMEAMKAFTIWPAYGAFQERDKGTISVGKYADFTIFKIDFRRISPHEIPDDDILGTIVAGKLVFASPQWKTGEKEKE